MTRLVTACVVLFALPFAVAAGDDAFREATALARKGDLPAAIEAYRGLAASGTESASLYWNWAQAAAARGSVGEALWALLRARELEPGDAAIAREIEQLRQAANLDRAELSPVPLASVARFSVRYRVGLFAAVLLIVSVALHAAARVRTTARWPVAGAWTAGIAGVLLAAIPVAGSFAAPTAVVVQRGEPLADAASPTANVLATLREGEVVPVLDESGGYLRVEDSSGARGWATAEGVRRLDRPPSSRSH
jgi:hypothetical protein